MKAFNPTNLAVPLLVLLNTVAIGGQAFWFAEHVTNGNMIFAVAIATVIELIGVFLASMAHASVMANQSAGSTRPGSYAVGALAGWLNWAHWGGAAGITFGVLSAISPYLWSVWSRYTHRQRLAELGLADTRGLRLSTARKVMHPIRSFKLFRFAAWEGITDVEAARLALAGEPVADVLPQDAAEIVATQPLDPAFVWTDEDEEMFKAVAEDETPAPERVRRPRGEITPELRSAVDLLIAGVAPPQIEKGPGASAAVVGRYARVVRILRDDPHAVIDAEREKVRPALVDEIRAAMRELGSR